MSKHLGTAEIRNKGEITIPKNVREFLKIKTGDKISMLWENGKVVVKREKTIYEDFKPESD